MMEDVIEHVGVKGMRWGVRRDSDSGSSSKSIKKVAKAEAKWEKKTLTPKNYYKLHNQAAQKANEVDVPRINNMPRYRGKDFTRDTPLRREYYQAHQTALNRRMQEAVDSTIGPSPSGRRITINPTDGTVTIQEVQHAEGSGISIKFDKKGHIVEFLVDEDELFQEDLVGSFLIHYGIKGMRWGVRKSSNRSGGKKPAPRRSADAKKAQSVLARQKKSGTQALSNSDIQIAIRRLQLEQQLSTLTPRRESTLRRGQRAINETLNMGNSVNRAIQFANSPAGRAMAGFMAGAAGAAAASRMGNTEPRIRLPNLQLNP
jgi:hypothetical protein